MALVDLTKQLAQQALLSATQDPPPAQAEGSGMVMLSQLSAMQKALKDDEELVVFFQSGAERIRVTEIFMPTPQVAVLSGVDANRLAVRVVSAVPALQVVTRIGKVQAGSKALRVSLAVPKGRDGK